MMKSMIYKPPAFMEQPNSQAYNISTFVSCYTQRIEDDVNSTTRNEDVRNYVTNMKLGTLVQLGQE